MKKFVVVAGFLATISMVGAVQGNAQESGLAGMHAQHVVKGRLCFSNHTHVGSSGAERSKRAALAAAARDWSSFTAFEYGPSWARWRQATAKNVMCERSSGSWSCEVHARPCFNRKVRSIRQAKR